jgi:hypothetical protein
MEGDPGDEQVEEDVSPTTALIARLARENVRVSQENVRLRAALNSVVPFANKGDLVAIRETLFSGGYDATEGEPGSADTTWTDFGVVIGIADRLVQVLKEVLTELEDVPYGSESWASRLPKFVEWKQVLDNYYVGS